MLISSQAVESFHRDGYVVVPGVVPASLCEAVITAIRDFTGVDPQDPSSWYPRNFEGHGIVPMHHHPALWAVRQHPSVHAVFAAIYGDPALWVSMDRASFKPPVPEAADWQPAAIHWDCDPWSFDELSVQGLVYLTDTDVTQGPFVCVPGIYREIDSWRAQHAGDAGRRHPEVDDSMIVPVTAPAGSLVLFHRLMPHSSALNRGARPRFVQYVAMQPAGGELERRQRVKEWENQWPPKWAIRQQVEGQHIPERWPREPLSPLGRKLVGIDTWQE